MQLDNLNNLDSLLDEVSKLKKRSQLLEAILNYYDAETMTFNIPEKWKGTRIRPDKLPAESPRHLLLKKIQDNLSNEELQDFNIPLY